MGHFHNTLHLIIISYIKVSILIKRNEDHTTVHFIKKKNSQNYEI